MAERKQEEVNNSKLAEYILDLGRSPHEETRKIADLLLLVTRDAYGDIMNITSFLREKIQHEQEIDRTENELHFKIIDYLRSLSSRVDKLEGEREPSHQETQISERNQLDNLKSQVAEQQNFLNEHKETLETLKLLSESTIRDFILELDKKGKNHD